MNSTAVALTKAEPALPVPMIELQEPQADQSAIEHTVSLDLTEEDGIPFGPIFVTSVAVVTSIFFVVTGAAMWAITGGVWDGIGVGAFAAFWGGPGFGLMAAGATWTFRQERLGATKVGG